MNIPGRYRYAGFTLVEMMVVISVLGLVLAIGTPPLVEFLRHTQSNDSAQLVAGILRKARSRAIHEKNEFVVFFDLANNRMSILDDDGGGNGHPSDPSFDPSNRGNGRRDSGEQLMGPYTLPDGQVFGFVGSTVDTDGNYVSSPVTFSGDPPRIVFYPNGSTNEEGLVFVMPNKEFREQEKGLDKMLFVRRSTGSVIIERPEYN
jgi:prepilin-type N-terminal cleavage/methylation domain-containing protein